MPHSEHLLHGHAFCEPFSTAKLFVAHSTSLCGIIPCHHCKFSAKLPFFQEVAAVVLIVNLVHNIASNMGGEAVVHHCHFLTVTPEVIPSTYVMLTYATF